MESEWELPCWEGKSKDNSGPKDTAHALTQILHEVVIHGLNYDVFIRENNKCLNSTMNLSEYFCVIGCRLIIACYVSHSIRDLFLKDSITPQKGSQIRLNQIISGRRLVNITKVMSYTNFAIIEFNDPFFQQRHMKEGWSKNMAENFNPSRVSVLDEST